jgi:hypothetical protein
MGFKKKKHKPAQDLILNSLLETKMKQKLSSFLRKNGN